MTRPSRAAAAQAAAPPPAGTAAGPSAAPPPPRATRRRRAPPPAPAARAEPGMPPDAAAADGGRDVRRRRGAGARRAERATRTSFLPTLIGPIGLYHVSTAEVGPACITSASGCTASTFRSTGFLVEGANGTPDTNTRFDGSFTFGFTPHESIELFGGDPELEQSQPPRMPEPGRRDPELIKSFGDLVLGGKGGRAGRARLHAPAPSWASGSCRGSPTCRSRRARRRSGSGRWRRWTCGRPATTPLRFHANVNFYLDNSSNLYDFDGHHDQHARGGDVRLRDPGQPAAVRARRRRAARALHRARRRCSRSSSTTSRSSPRPPIRRSPTTRRPRQPRPALADASACARASTGASRSTPASTSALRSVGYQYGPPLAPYDLIFGVAFPFDIDGVRAPGRRDADRREGGAPPTTGTVVGTVKGKADGKPIADAVVSFAGQPHARVATDPDGSFQSVPLPPGPDRDHGRRRRASSRRRRQAVVVAGSAATLEVALVRQGSSTATCAARCSIGAGTG